MHALSPVRAAGRHGLARKGARLLWAGLCLAVLAAGCAKKDPAPQEPELPPAPPVAFESPERFVQYLFPANQELSSWKEMAPTLRKSLAYVKSKPAGGVAVQRPGLRLTWGQMTRTLRTLQSLLPELDAHPELFLQHFKWVEVDSGINYSGYYEPVVKASRTPKSGYPQPLYARPPELTSHLARRGRYHDRKAIDVKGVLRGRGLELAWAADPVDVFFLQIQGSGRLQFDDGTQAYVNYNGQNKHKYKSSGRIMREKGLLREGHIFEQRQWFRDNPDRVWEILTENPSYVFFKFGHRGPTGAMGHVVDDWMSLATDRKFIPLGAIVAYGVNIPDEKRGVLPLRAIGFAQDVGGAIKKNRIDIFCGGSGRAEYVASHLDAKGPAWVLVAK